MKRWRMLLGAVVAVVLALVVGWKVHRRSSERGYDDGGGTSASDWRSAGGRGASGGLRALATDPATPPLEWGREGVQVELPEEVQPLHELMKLDEEALEEMMELLHWAMLVGPGEEAGLAMVRCAARFEPRLESRCGWEMQAVVRRSGEDTGEIVYARAVVTRGAEQAACRALASCYAAAWAAREPVPMPERVGDELVFSQWAGSLWDPSKGIDAVAYYRRMATQEQAYVDELTAVAAGPHGVAPVSLGWNSLLAQDRADGARCMVEVIEGREDGCGG